MSSINFVNAYWLLLAIPLVVLFAVPFFLAVRRDNVNGHNIASGVMHVVMALLIAFSAAGTNVVTTLTETDVYVLADVSYSSHRNLDAIDRYIDGLADALPRNGRLGVVCFGKDQQFFSPLAGRRAQHRSVKEAKVDDSETDLISALEYTASLFREGVVKRIVVVSDGAQTYLDDANALKRTVEKLAAEKVKVDAIFLDNNIKAGEKELQVSSVQAAENVFVGRAQTVSVIVQSNEMSEAFITLKKDGVQTENRAVTLSKGSNSISLPLDTSEVGTHEYEVSVRAQNEGDDANAFNNTRTFSQTVTDELNVLLVAGDTSAYDEIAPLFTGATIDDRYVPQERVPITVEELCAYDEIILSGANVADIPNCDLFMESVNTVVSRFGKSLLTIGDTSLQNDTEGKYKTLSQMLPVKFGNTSDRPKLFTIVLDTSSSMAEGGKFDRAKTAAKRLIDNLNEDDEVAIVFFNGNRGYIQRHTKVGDAAKKAELKAAVDAQWFEHGTDIKLGFETVRDLYSLDFSEKQVMLISDGLDLNITGSGYESPLALVDELRANGIYTSVIDIGRLGDTGAAATKAKVLLQDIASAAHGGGKHYEMINDDQLDVSFGEIENDLAETIVEENSFVEVKRVRDSVLDGVEFSSNSYVSGFVSNKDSGLSTTVVLNAIYEKEGGDVTVPLYAYRTLGNGRVASFTSDMGAWTNRGWPKATRDAFFTNMLFTNVPQEKSVVPFTVKTEENGGYVNIEIVPATVRIDAETIVRVTMPDGQVIENNLAFASTGYFYTFAMPQRGKYEIAIEYRYGQYDYTAQRSAHSSFTAEYDSFTVYDAGVLNRMVGANGAVSLDGKLSLTNDEGEVGTYTVSLTVPLLAAAVALFAVDIIVRKLKWEDIVSLFRKVK